MTQTFFSSHAIAELLERDRQTIVRALRNVPPDTMEGGRPRWRLVTALRAVDALPGSYGARITHRSTSTDGNLTQLAKTASAAWDAAFDDLTSTKALAARRAAARKMVPLLHEMIAAIAARDTADGLHEQHVLLRGLEIFRLGVRAVAFTCKWQVEDTHRIFDPPLEGDDEAA